MQIQCPRHLEGCQIVAQSRECLTADQELHRPSQEGQPMLLRSGWERAAGHGAAGTAGLARTAPSTAPHPQRWPVPSHSGGALGKLPFPGHDPKSFTHVPAPAAFPSQDFALIWRFPELVGGNRTLLGSDCISGWGHSRRHLAWLLRDQGG